MKQFLCCVCCVDAESPRNRDYDFNDFNDFSSPESDVCPHCQSHFIWSDLLMETSDRLTLQCSRCQKTYRLSNSPDQRNRLSNEYGQPSQIEPLINVQQLRRGDVIAFKRWKANAIPYEHHAVVTDVNYETGEVQVVEFAMGLPLRKGVIARETMNFDEDILPENSWVRRYMPLDCLPLGEVIGKANAFVDRPSTQPKYDLFRCNCQHLASYCKTGRMVSDEATSARSYYHYALHGFQLFSLFVLPPLLPGVLLFSATDVIVRLGRVCRTELDLIKMDMKSPQEAIGTDAVSIGATALFALTATAVLVFKAAAR